jgi:rhodanese-related sulfurtransferase
MLKQRIMLVVGLLFMLGMAHAANDDEFPNRKLFPAVPVISLEDLYNKMDKVIIVDARSKYEHDTINITDALNIPVDDTNFVERMRKLRADNPKTQIVAYCNGKTCKKSYEAVQKCRNAGIQNVVAYDAGIFDWAKKYPQKSTLLGTTPVDLSKLISKDDVQKRMISVDEFENMLARKDVIVLDIREPLQREGLSLFPGIDKEANMDDKASLDKYINQALRENKTLLVYDAAGKQVEWLMYYLQNKGVDRYAFMKGGAQAYFAKLRRDYVK